MAELPVSDNQVGCRSRHEGVDRALVQALLPSQPLRDAPVTATTAVIATTAVVARDTGGG
jgi:hypothetical protein